MFGAVLIMLPAVVRVWSRVGDSLGERFGETGRIAGENLKRGLTKSSILVATIALCVAGSVAAATLPQSFRHSIRSWYGFEGDIAITSRASRGGWLGAPIASGFDEQLQRLQLASRLDSMAVLPG